MSKGNLWMFDRFFEQITVVGSLSFYVFLLVFVLILGECSLFVQLLVSLSLVMSSVILVRMLFFRNRPIRRRYSTAIQKIDASSFPSAHAMKVMSLALILGAYFDSLPMSAFLSALAVIVCYSRIHLRKHHPSDVVFGIVFSSIINLVVLLCI